MIKKGSKLGAYIGIIFVNIMWGLSFIGSKKAMAAGLTPFTLMLLRFGISVIVLLPCAIIKKESLRLKLRDVPLVLLTALTGITVYFWFELNGLKCLSASTASLIIAAIPVLTMIAHAVFFKSRQPLINWLGALISIAGVYLVVTSDDSGDTLQGALMIFGACICWVAYIELTGIALRRCSSLSLTLWQSIFACITILPFVPGEGVVLSEISLEGMLWACGFLGLICSALCYILYNYAIKQLDAVRTAIFLNLNPLSTVVGGVLLLDESIRTVQVIGGIMILAGLFSVSRGSKSNESEVGS